MGEGDFAALGVELGSPAEDGSRGELGLVTAMLRARAGAAAPKAAQREQATNAGPAKTGTRVIP